MKKPNTPKAHSSKRDKIRVLLVDEHALIRRGLADILATESDIEICGQTTNGEALAAMAKCKPDIVVFDITLFPSAGLDLVKQMAFDPKIKIVTVNLNGEGTYATRALRSGAKGYLTNDVETKLAFAIRRVVSGKLCVSDDIAQLMVAALTQGEDEGKGIESFSDRELELAELVGRGMSASETAKRMGISIKTIETHKAHMKKKLGIQKGSQLTRYCVQWVEQRSSQ